MTAWLLVIWFGSAVPSFVPNIISESECDKLAMYMREVSPYTSPYNHRALNPYKNHNCIPYETAK